MSDEEGRKAIIFSVTKSSVSDSPFSPSRVQVQFTAVADVESSDRWVPIERRLGEEGLKVYDGPSIVDEAITALKAELEQEKQRHADAERVLQDRVVQLESEVAHANRRAEIAMTENQRLVPENIRLRGLEAALTEIAGLALERSGNIGP